MPPSKKSTSKKKATSSDKKTAKSTAKKKSTKSTAAKKKPAPRKRKAPTKAKKTKVEEPKPIDERSDVMADLDKIVDAEDSGTPERDYGVADILGSADDDAPPPIDADDDAGDRLSIESILRGETLDDEPEDEDQDVQAVLAPKPKKVAKKKKRRFRWSALIPLAVFILAILLVAEGAGLFGASGLEKTNQLWNKVTAVFTGGDKDSKSNTSSQPQPVVPSMVSVNFLLTTEAEEGLSIPSVTTRVIETEVMGSDTFNATGEAESDDAVAVGKIMVTNDTTNDYQFVATTRFLSEDGVLFRLKEASAIPAESKTEVEVYADEAGPSGDIGPSKFTVPGLGADYEETVYGRSAADMTGGSGKVAAISEGDIERAKSELQTLLMNEAVGNFKSMITNGELVLEDLITANELESEFPEVETVGASFKGDLTLRFMSLVVPQDSVLPLLEEKLAEELSADLNPEDYQLGSPLYTVEAFDTTSNRAEIRVEVSVQ